MKKCRKVNCRREEIFFFKHNRKMYIFAQKIETRMMLQTSISRPRPSILGSLLMAICCLSARYAMAQETGDLLFVRSQASEMEKAISASTGEYTHVALVERDPSGYVWVIEADRQKGVQRLPFQAWDKAYNGQYDVFRFTQPFDTTDMILRARGFVGQPYDEGFLPDNNKFYCSELIYECFWKDGEHLFEAQPMNWRDANGNIPEYWIDHFQKLGVPVPEGVPGTNPTDMAKSPLLQKVGD